MAIRSILRAGAALATLAAIAPAQAEAVEQATGVDEIVVTAAGREQEVRNAPASISVISRETLERMPYRELTDALMEVPGVTVTTGEGNSRDISIRGMGAEYTLVMVDGRRLSSRESRTNGGNISEGGMFPPMEAIERIEVVRGPMSSLYGSDAMGGVVNIITRRIAESWRGSARINGTMQAGDEFGNYAGGNFYLSGPVTTGVGLQVQGSMNRREGDTTLGGTPERRDDSLSAKLGFALSPDHEILVEGGYYRQKVIEVAGETTEATTAAPYGTENIQTQERYVVSASHSGKWGFANSESYVQFEDAKNVESEKRIKNLVGQSIWVVPLPSNTLSVGVYGRREDLIDLSGNLLSGSTTTGTKRDAWAVFAENELKLLDGFALTGGIRMDHDQLYGVHWTPRVYAVWNINPAFTLKGGYSQGFRAPSLRQTLADWGQSSRGGTIYGNPNLEAETSRTIEAAVLFQSGGLQASLTAYDTRFNDKISRLTCVAAGAWCVDEPLSSIGRPPTTYINIDKARLRGIEATIDIPLSDTLRFNATGTLTDSEQLSGTSAGAALNDTPKEQASASLNWKPNDRLRGFVRAVYRGKEAVTEAQISGTNVFAPAYTTADIGASYSITRNFTVHGGVQNMFDKRVNYEESAFVIDGARMWIGIGTRF